MSASHFIENIKHSSLDEILSIRESLGAILHRVYLVKRTWDGSQIGDGNYSDEVIEIKPAPKIKDYSQSIHISQGGVIESGDLIIEMISKNQFPHEKEINAKSEDPSLEIFYMIGDQFYRVISIIEKYLVWNVQVRRMSDQSRRING